MLLGHWQEMKAIGQAQGALAALAELLPDDAERVVDDGGVETVPLVRLAAGRRRARPARRPRPRRRHDRRRAAEFDESMITGESRPVAEAEGDSVAAGTVSTDSAFRVRVEAVGDDTALAGIQRLVAEAQATQPRPRRWPTAPPPRSSTSRWRPASSPSPSGRALGDVDDADRPHRHRARHRLPARAGSGHPAGHRDLDRGRPPAPASWSRTALPSSACAPSTSCSSTRRAPSPRAPRRHRRRRLAEMTDDEVLRLAAAVESDSEHPLARAIVAAAQRRRRRSPRHAGSSRSPGGASRRRSDGTASRWAVPRCSASAGSRAPTDLDTRRRLAGAGRPSSTSCAGTTIVGAVALEDQVRPRPAEAVERLQTAASGSR